MSAFSVFTTALVQGGQVKWLDEHLQRLREHALAFAIPYPGDAILQEKVSGISGYQVDTCLIRIALSLDGIDIKIRAVNPPTGSGIVVSDVCVDRRFAHFKTSEAEPYVTARQFAAERGAIEALLVDEDGYVVDGSRSSPLLYRGGTLISLEGGLRGITREKVLQAARERGMGVERAKLRAHELNGLLMVAGSGVGLVPAESVSTYQMAELVEEFRTLGLT